jgi:hypothetical protein
LPLATQLVAIHFASKKPPGNIELGTPTQNNLQKSPGQHSAQILLKFIKDVQQKGFLPGGLLFLGFIAKVPGSTECQ